VLRGVRRGVGGVARGGRVVGRRHGGILPERRAPRLARIGRATGPDP
jgi:hypothetical protein